VKAMTENQASGMIAKIDVKKDKLTFLTFCCRQRRRHIKRLRMKKILN